MQNLQLQKTTVLNPADPLAEKVLQAAGVTIGGKTVFGPVFGVSANGGLIIEEDEGQLFEYQIADFIRYESLGGEFVGSLS